MTATGALTVVGAGLGRTGTHSLKVALEQLLGGPCHHMAEVFPSDEQRAGWTRAIDGEVVDWSVLLAGYRAIVDWPGAGFWRELHATYPDALVLLSVRDPGAWYRSASNTIFVGARDEALAGDPWMAAMVKLFGERFCGELDDRAAMIDAFVRHNDEVRSTVPADQLLEWTVGDGWGPICERLGVAVPDEPFPLTNTEDQFRARRGLPPVGA